MLCAVAVIGICVAVSVSFLFTGSVLAVGFLRFRDRRRTRLTNTLSRGLSTYHRAHLSIDGINYPHIPELSQSLPRSRRRPYTIIAGRWAGVPSQESLRLQHMTSIEEQPDSEDTVQEMRRERSFRRTFHGHSLTVPKNRRQNRFGKAIVQNLLPPSPLSAITEFTDQSGHTSPTAIELPTIITPRETPDRTENDRPQNRPDSIQWPLPPAMCKLRGTMESSETSTTIQNSNLVRQRSIDAGAQTEKPRMSRSVSMASAISDAPAGPLPPLPLRNIRRQSQRDVDTSRYSNASLDTISSSVLGAISGSPTQKTTNTSGTPLIDLASPWLYQFSRNSSPDGPSAITVGAAAGRRAQPSTANGSGTHSFRASIKDQATLRKVSNSRAVDLSDQRFRTRHLFDDSFKRIDACSWRFDLPVRSESHRTPVRAASRDPGNYKSASDVNTAGLLSRFEPQIKAGKRASYPIEHTSAAEILTGSPRQLVPPRPASVAGSNLHHWDLKPPAPISASPMVAMKGHRRQNCVRISNLPVIDPKKHSRLPEMIEADEEGLGTPESRPEIPGLTLLEVESVTPALRARASVVDIKASPSPFNNRPVLNPTSRRRTSHQRRGSIESQGTPRPDSDIFTKCYNDMATPNINDGRHLKSRSHWPLSPTSQSNIKLNSTPPTLLAIEEPCDPDSPMLPSPVLSSTALFTRRLNAPQGPRNLPTTTRSSLNSSPSPLHGRIGQTPKGDELRRSVMLLRRGTREGKLLDQASRLYRNMGERSVSNFSLPVASQGHLGAVSKNTYVNDKGKSLHLALGGSTDLSRSRSAMTLSPSMMSIWDDASVCEDSDLEARISMLLHIPEQTTLGSVDPEAYENFIGQQQKYTGRRLSDWKDRERERILTSPQGQGLGITNWGTPRSLYDTDGFLKEQ